MSETINVLVPDDHEGTAWLRGATADAERRARAAQADLAEPSVAVVTIGPPALPGTREDRTCDRCRTFVDECILFWSFLQRRSGGVYIVGGLCDECREFEGLPSSAVINV